MQTAAQHDFLPTNSLFLPHSYAPSWRLPGLQVHLLLTMHLRQIRRCETLTRNGVKRHWRASMNFCRQASFFLVAKLHRSKRRSVHAYLLLARSLRFGHGLRNSLERHQARLLQRRAKHHCQGHLCGFGHAHSHSWRYCPNCGNQWFRC